jgi:capsular polysaccharide biosynthesis protein
MPAKKVEGIVFDLGIVCKPIPLNIEIVNFYRKIATRILEQEPINIKKSEKIYISRRNSSKRILTNEEQIEELLKKLGFDIYYMEHYTFEQQIAIMEQASIVVAPHGAGLANILFCPTGTKIVEFRIDKYPIDCFEKMSLICQHKYYPILGHLESQNASKDKSSFYWTVDADKVKKVVEKLVN